MEKVWNTTSQSCKHLWADGLFFLKGASYCFQKPVEKNAEICWLCSTVDMNEGHVGSVIS